MMFKDVSWAFGIAMFVLAWMGMASVLVERGLTLTQAAVAGFVWPIIVASYVAQEMVLR